MPEIERIETARKILGEHHEVLVARLGINYKLDPRFEEAARGIALGRTVQSVLLDIAGHGF